jgi:hypothetical protein
MRNQVKPVGVSLSWQPFLDQYVAFLEYNSGRSKDKVYSALDFAFSIKLAQGKDTKVVLITTISTPIEYKHVRIGS